jgi:energy-coupling factor transporter ATP-binding protein EcfA2
MDEQLLSIYQEAYRDLDLFPLVEPEEIERFRVDYGTEVLIRLKREAEASPKDGKLVFAGHRGCGRSTLLKRFSVEMQPKYFTVFFSIANLIEMSDVSHITILYAIALMLLSRATKQRVGIPPATQKALLDWFTTAETETTTKDMKSELGAGGDIFKFISVKLKREETFRAEVKRTYERKISVLVDKANEIAGYIQRATQKPVLVVIDDLDKLDLSQVEAIYRSNIKSLFSPRFQVIFTIPISALRDPAVSGALTSEGIVRVQQFPVAKFFSKADCRNPDAQPIAKTLKLFLSVLEKRIPTDLMEPEVAEAMVLKSGGVIRELVRIARECCTEAMVLLESEPDRADVKIDQDILNVALRNLRNDFDRLLGTQLYQILRQVHENLTPTEASDDDFIKLLHGLCVLEYQNDDLWYDVHPIVMDLLRRKQLNE